MTSSRPVLPAVGQTVVVKPGADVSDETIENPDGKWWNNAVAYQVVITAVAPLPERVYWRSRKGCLHTAYASEVETGPMAMMALMAARWKR